MSKHLQASVNVYKTLEIWLWPLMRVRNSSCLTLLFCMSIFSVNSKVNRNLCSSNRPRDAYLKTSKVIYSMMLAIRLLVTGFLADLSTYISFKALDAFAIVFTFEFLLTITLKLPYIHLQHLYKRCTDAWVFSPGQREVKYPQKLSQGGLIHDIYHIHFCDQEVKDTASCCNWKHRHVTERVLLLHC